MVVIRLARGGAKKSPFYTVVVTDKKARRDSNWIERIGYFNPVAAGKSPVFHIDQERYDYWISKGAQPSDRVSSLLKNHKKAAA